jgi:hypothetical protein
VEGYRLIFDRELAIEVRNTHLDSAEEAGGILETMRIKVFVMVPLLLFFIFFSFAVLCVMMSLLFVSMLRTSRLCFLTHYCQLFFYYLVLAEINFFVLLDSFSIFRISLIECRFGVQGDENHPTQTCIELLCETDLFLYYIQEVDASVFAHLQGQQKLIMDYNEYHKFIVKIVLQCLAAPQTYDFYLFFCTLYSHCLIVSIYSLSSL